jgi:hypothetical protein
MSPPLFGSRVRGEAASSSLAVSTFLLHVCLLSSLFDVCMRLYLFDTDGNADEQSMSAYTS